ncbi:MAG: hypoxanthine phosphoribosyltransferase [Cyclobacteriaceae bacterium]
MIKIGDKNFHVFLSKEEINSMVRDLALRINQDYRGKDPLLISVLNGSFIFSADLIRQLDFDPQISFTKLASYQGTSSTGNVDELIGLNQETEGRHILILEDIVDTGNTLEKLVGMLKKKKAASIETVALLFKSQVYKKDIPVKYYGKDIPNKFVVGYGLDYNERGRSLDEIYQIGER